MSFKSVISTVTQKTFQIQIRENIGFEPTAFV